MLVAGLSRRGVASRWDVVLLALCAVQTAAYGAYWYRGELLGPRFLYTVAAAIIVLVARAPFIFGDRLGARASCARPRSRFSPACSSRGSLRRRRSARAASRRRREDSAGVSRWISPAPCATRTCITPLVFLHEPFSLRLTPPSLGTGPSARGRAGLLATRDACALLAAIDAAERDTTATLAQKVAIMASLPLVVNPQGHVRDRIRRFTSRRRSR